jgi:hypothetical protein
MTRRLLNLLTAVSLLLCVAAIGFGLYGFREGSREPHWSFRLGPRHEVVLASDRGALFAVYSTGWPVRDWKNEGPMHVVAEPLPLTIRNALLVEFTEERWTLSDGRATANVRFSGVRTNFLYATLFAAALPLARLLRRVTRTCDPNHCTSCGYDLRATPGGCPECGSGREG